MVDSETYQVALCWAALARFLQFFHLVCYQLWDKWYMVLEEVGEYSRQDLLKAQLINKLPWHVFSPIYLHILYTKYIITNKYMFNMSKKCDLVCLCNPWSWRTLVPYTIWTEHTHFLWFGISLNMLWLNKSTSQDIIRWLDTQWGKNSFIRCHKTMLPFSLVSHRCC